MIIYYNPDCSKCREAHEILEKNNCNIQIRNYLVDPPTEKELKELIEKLGCKAIDIVRKSEPLFTERFHDKDLTDTEWLKVLSENPVLIERPIVIDGQRAILGRPPSLVLQLVPGQSHNS
ncbi:MAG TPA: arsenate reductase family protein [Bacteroidia bacterium]|nr:arsenate reductase family protein [Bacteroidia bacterium]